MKEKEEVEDKDDRFVCKIMGFKICTDCRQYIVRYDVDGLKSKGGKDKVGGLLGYFGTLYHALGAMRQELMREATVNSKTIEEVFNRIIALDAKFYKALEPLKKIEDLDFKFK